MNSVRSILAAVLLLALLPVVSQAQREYKEYTVSRVQHDYFLISFDKDNAIIEATLGDQDAILEFEKDEIDRRGNRFMLHGQVLFDEIGLHIADTVLPFDLITDSRVSQSAGMITVEFYTGDEDSQRILRLRRGNRIEPMADVAVPQSDFVRGMVFTVTGDVNIAGEVGRDVISLGGRITVDEGAVIRGDVVSMYEEIKSDRNTTIYGELYSGKAGHRLSSPRFRRRADNILYGASLGYNRVDGLRLSGELGYDPDDPYLPVFEGEFGYAFESQRTRWELGVSQAIIAGLTPLKVGARYFRRLASEDDWILTDVENLPFTLLVTEDFKDYYESEGGMLYVSWIPFEDLMGTIGYRYESTRWFPAEQDLWSLFGGSKKFRENYYFIDDPLRPEGIAAVDSNNNASLLFKADYDTRDMISPYERSAWQAGVELEWSSPDVESEFDYRRYTIVARRHQMITDNTMLLMRAMYSGSDGFLPMHKRFFLGGLGTLRGYEHKEFYGTRLWMVNAEYRFEIPGSDIAISALYDAGKIANEAKLDSDIDLRQSTGLALGFGGDVQISLSKRLDTGEDDDLQFWVRFNHIF